MFICNLISSFVFIITVTDFPKLKHLHRYKKQISSNWYDLGIELLDDECYDELNTIIKNNPNDINMCCSRMLQLWLRKSKKPSWKNFIRALRKIEMDDLAYQIESLFNAGL